MDQNFGILPPLHILPVKPPNLGIGTEEPLSRLRDLTKTEIPCTLEQFSYDHTYNKKLILELKADVKAADLNITQALEVGPGLKTRPVQNPSTERLIKIDYTPIKMSNTDIDEVMAVRS